MTTIAYRDGVMAADTLHTLDGVRSGYAPKIVRTADGRLVGGTGDATYLSKLLAWAESPEFTSYRLFGRFFPTTVAITPPEPGDNEGSGIIIELDGSVTILEPGGSFSMTAPFYAAGSGGRFARGAMSAGASAEAAVKAAIEMDCFSGGEITVLRR